MICPHCHHDTDDSPTLPDVRDRVMINGVEYAVERTERLSPVKDVYLSGLNKHGYTHYVPVIHIERKGEKR
jgi:hypothetical protein